MALLLGLILLTSRGPAWRHDAAMAVSLANEHRGVAGRIARPLRCVLTASVQCAVCIGRLAETEEGPYNSLASDVMPAPLTKLALQRRSSVSPLYLADTFRSLSCVA